jgi:hypothetical protein
MDRFANLHQRIDVVSVELFSARHVSVGTWGNRRPAWAAQVFIPHHVDPVIGQRGIGRGAAKSPRFDPRLFCGGAALCGIKGTS